jgi:hypothetical protein
MMVCVWQGTPAFVGSDSCGTYFVWQSSAACPQTIVSGSNCVLTDLLSGFTYDLTSLRNTAQDYRCDKLKFTN